MIHVVVQNQESVVRFFVPQDSNWSVLCVVAVNVELQLFANAVGVNGCRHAVVSFLKHKQRTFVNVVVNQYNAAFCRFYQPAGEFVGIENLSVEKDSFHWRQDSTDKKVNFVFCLRNTLFQSFYSLIY